MWRPWENQIQSIDDQTKILTKGKNFLIREKALLKIFCWFC